METLQISPSNDVAPSPKEQRLSWTECYLVTSFYLTLFFDGLTYSLLAPFFPVEALGKGLSMVTVGFIIGVYEFMIVLMCAFFGAYLLQIGIKFMYVTSVLSYGVLSLLFGVLEWCPPGKVFTVMCVLVRVFQGVAAAASITAIFSVLSKMFTDNLSLMLGLVSMFFSLGMMIGAPVGGALYQVGGFVMPFVLSFALFEINGLASLFCLGSLQRITEEDQKAKYPSGSLVLSMLKIPLISIVLLVLLMTAAAQGFFYVTLSQELESRYSLSYILVGVVFFVAAVSYSFTAPIWGWIADRYNFLTYWLLFAGLLVRSLSLWVIAPLPFIPIFPQQVPIWLMITALCFLGFGMATIVLMLKIIKDCVVAAGFGDSLRTYGAVAGLFQSAYFLGLFLGPLVGGILTDELGYPWAATIAGFSGVVCILALAGYMIVERIRAKKTSGDEQRLIDATKTSPSDDRVKLEN